MTKQGYKPETSSLTTPPNTGSSVMPPNLARIPPEIDMTAIGYETGAACGQFLKGFFQGIADAMDTLEDAALLDAAANTTALNHKENVGKTDIEDCRHCWCDICANLELCAVLHVSYCETSEIDEERPNPCVGCRDGMRGEPTTKAASCGYFIRGQEHNYD
jgi:hypothetical protein